MHSAKKYHILHNGTTKNFMENPYKLGPNVWCFTAF